MPSSTAAARNAGRKDFSISLLATRAVENFVAIHDRKRTRFMRRAAHLIEDRLRRHDQRHGRKISMAEREDLRAQRERRTILRADVTEVGERVETPSDGGARDAGAKTQLRDRHLPTLLRESTDHCQTA